MGQSMSKTPGDMHTKSKLLKAAKEADTTLGGGDDVSRTAEELADHIEKTHEVVGEAVKTLAESAGNLIDETIGNEGLGAAAKLVVEGVENVALNPVLDVSHVVAGHGSEIAHTVARNVLETTETVAGGMPDVSPSSMSEFAASAEHAVGENVEEFADSVGQFIGGTIGTDGAGAAANVVVEGAEDGLLELTQKVASSELAESAVEAVTEEAASELLGTAVDVVPIVGQCLSGWRMLRGTITATVGVGAIAVSASIAAAAYVTANERAKQTAREIAWWGASLTGDGTFLAAKGATNMVSVVPGTQFITIPGSMGLGLASSRCAKMRSA